MIAIKRVGFGFISQGMNQTVTIFLQLASVPILASCWGGETYGRWVMLTTLPTYLSFLDLGFSQAAANDMAMKLAAGDVEGAREDLHGVFALFLCLSLPISLLICLFVANGAAPAALGYGDSSTRLTIVFLTIYCALSLLSGIAAAGLRADGLFSLMVVLSSSGRLIEGLAVMAVAAIGHRGILGAASVMLALRVLTAVAFVAALRLGRSRLSLGLRRARVGTVRRLAYPSLMFLGFPLGNALCLQGQVLLMGHYFGAAAAGLFAVNRTLARVGVNSLGLINHIFSYEYSIRNHDPARFRRIGILHFALQLLGIVAFSAGLTYVGESLFNLWVRGRFQFQPLMFSLITLQSVFEILWAALLTPLIALNRHGGAAAHYVAASVAACVGAAVCVSAGWGLASAPACLTIAYAVLAALALLRASPLFVAARTAPMRLQEAAK